MRVPRIDVYPAGICTHRDRSSMRLGAELPSVLTYGTSQRRMRRVNTTVERQIDGVASL